MPRHEFGIMLKDPKKRKRYDKFEPDKCDCISVDDELIRPLLEKLSEVKCYWHILDRLEVGLAYTGINLIPPESCGLIKKVLKNEQGLSELASLLSKAEKEDKFVIHFGI